MLDQDYLEKIAPGRRANTSDCGRRNQILHRLEENEFMKSPGKVSRAKRFWGRYTTAQRSQACRGESSVGRVGAIRSQRATVAIGKLDFVRAILVGHHDSADLPTAQKQCSSAFEMLLSAHPAAMR
jgi:hypothetical protein